jgi:putative long chain acyl-CoA synthase
VSGLVETEYGPVPPAAARTALEMIPAVDLCVAYGVPSADSQVLVAAVTLHPGATLSAVELNRVFDRLPSTHRPDYIQVVPSIPVTTWHRPLWVRMRQTGIPEPTRARAVWRLAPDRAHYEVCER